MRSMQAWRRQILVHWACVHDSQRPAICLNPQPMSDIFKKTVDHLPEILVKNASAMMLRMVAVMQQAVAADQQMENAAYCALVLKMTAENLAEQFDLAVRESMAAIRRDGGNAQFSATGLSLSIEAEDDATSSVVADFQSSTAAFDRVCAKASGLGVRGVRLYNKDVLLACVNEAFAKSRVDPSEAAKVLPFARRALNDELLRLYAKLDAL